LHTAENQSESELVKRFNCRELDLEYILPAEDMDEMKQNAASHGKVEHTGPEINGQTVVGTTSVIVVVNTLFDDIFKP
jgi:hypothetical protein